MYNVRLMELKQILDKVVMRKLRIHVSGASSDSDTREA